MSVYISINKILLENGILKEYLNRQEVSLVRYFNMTEDEKKQSLPYTFHYIIDDYTDDNFEDSIAYLEKIDGSQKYHKIADQLYNDLVNNRLDVFEEDKPAWLFFDYIGFVKNQWLIHFTNFAEDVAKEGFTQGVYDIDKLALTTKLSDFDKQYGGYNFAYLLSDYKKHYKSYGDLKYGEEAVIFQGSGIRLFHYGDEEPQVIFWGSKAKNIIPITECGEEYPYCIESIKTGQILYENDFEEVVQWIVNNYNQYRKHLHI